VSVFERAFVIGAGLLGAAGVASAAAAAHLASAAMMNFSALILLVHAPSLLGLAVALSAGLVSRLWGRVGGLALGLGACLFAADMAMRSFYDQSLFPLAAPSGGFGMIGGWLLIAFGGIFAKAGR
jgi:uncharacterized membrane protein YgdD (TMEM256/DUF423 family)